MAFWSLSCRCCFSCCLGLIENVFWCILMAKRNWNHNVIWNKSNCFIESESKNTFHIQNFLLNLFFSTDICTITILLNKIIIFKFLSIEQLMFIFMISLTRSGTVVTWKKCYTFLIQSHNCTFLCSLNLRKFGTRGRPD